MAHKKDEQRWQAECRQMLQRFTASSARTSHPHWPAVTRPSGPMALAASGHSCQNESKHSAWAILSAIATCSSCEDKL